MDLNSPLCAWLLTQAARYFRAVYPGYLDIQKSTVGVESVGRTIEE